MNVNWHLLLVDGQCTPMRLIDLLSTGNPREKFKSPDLKSRLKALDNVGPNWLPRDREQQEFIRHMSLTALAMY